MEYKSLPFEVKIGSDDRTFEGYASTWKKDLVNDQIQPGAFQKTLQERFPKDQIKILWQHNEPIGKPVFMQEDSKGLFVKGYISPTTLGNDALILLKDGVINTMSIGYDVVKDRLDEDGSTRHLLELKLYEFSLVTFPAQPEAIITSVKNYYDVVREIKAGRVLSQANFTRLQNIMTELQALLESATIEPSKDTEKNKPSNGTQKVDTSIFSTVLQEMKNYKIERGLH